MTASVPLAYNEPIFNDERSVFEIAQHLFSKSHYHDKQYSFIGKMHISKATDTITNNFDIFCKYASDQGGIFVYTDLIDYLASIGLKAGNLRAQVNCHAILKWSSSEVFIYLLNNDILFNDAYRHGLYRVGCKVCPMSAKWQDALISGQYHEEVEASLSLLEKITIYAKGKLDKQYIEDGGWQARAGGRILQQGENRIKEEFLDNGIRFIIKNYKQEMFSALPVLGSIVEADGCSRLVKTKHGIVNASCIENGSEQIVTITPTSKLDRYDISAIRMLANKAAYCIGCKACMPQCPTGAFRIVDGRISIRENLCVHCYN